MEDAYNAHACYRGCQRRQLLCLRVHGMGQLFAGIQQLPRDFRQRICSHESVSRRRDPPHIGTTRNTARRCAEHPPFTYCFVRPCTMSRSPWYADWQYGTMSSTTWLRSSLRSATTRPRSSVRLDTAMASVVGGATRDCGSSTTECSAHKEMQRGTVSQCITHISLAGPASPLW